MRSAHYERLQSVLVEEEAMLRLAERIGRFTIRSGEALPGAVEDGFPRRHRDAMHACSGYFSAPLLGGGSRVEGVESFAENAAFVEAALRLYGLPLVRPVAVTANLMLPGQRVALHTDVPEFRGIDRDRDPAWLSVAMHHSGFFDDWHIACATSTAWFGGSPYGGDFVFYPDGCYGRAVAVPAGHDAAILLDADSVFHGVDRLACAGAESPTPTAGMELRYEGDDAWVLYDGEQEIALYTWNDVRFSLSWRAHCYRDEEEERKAQERACDLTPERALDVLTEDLRARGRIGEDALREVELARTIVEEYVALPPEAPSAKPSD
jgi:hypothetical protein